MGTPDFMGKLYKFRYRFHLVSLFFRSLQILYRNFAEKSLYKFRNRHKKTAIFAEKRRFFVHKSSSFFIVRFPFPSPHGPGALSHQ